MKIKNKMTFLIMSVGIVISGIFIFKELKSNEKSISSSSIKNIKKDKENIPSVSATFEHKDFKDVKQESEYIISGEVIEKVNSYFLLDDVPFTDFKIKVDELYKGNLENEVIVTQDGNEEMPFDDYPLIEKGKKYIFF